VLLKDSGNDVGDLRVSWAVTVITLSIAPS
jgi:hypothetical protein